MLLFCVCFALFLAKLQLALSSDALSGFFWWNSKKGNLGDRELQSFQSLKYFCMDLTHSARGQKPFSPDQNFQYFFCLIALINLLHLMAYMKVNSSRHMNFHFSTEFQRQVDVSCWPWLLTPGSCVLQEQAQKGIVPEKNLPLLLSWKKTPHECPQINCAKISSVPQPVGLCLLSW